MKKILLATIASISLAGIAITAPARADGPAQGTPAAPKTPLQKTMDAMSVDLKAIIAQAADASKNADSANLADDFTANVLQAKTYVPDSISQAPEDQQASLQALYLQTLDQTAALGKQLAAAFRANDNAQAQTLLQQLAQAKKNGHDQFNNN